MRRRLGLLCALLLWPHTSLATTYYFSTQGNDLRSGLSPDSAMANLNLAPGLVRPGNTILFNRGDTWYVDSLAWDFSYKSGTAALPCSLGAYGSGPRPVIANMSRSTWNDSSGIYHGYPGWHHSAADSLDQVHRLYLAGTPLPRVSGIDSLVDSSYCVTNSMIYVRCSSCGDSATFEYTRRRNPYVVSGINTSYLTISDLEIKGGAGFVSTSFWAPTNHITLSDLYVHEFIGYGIGFGSWYAYTTSADKCNNISIINCTVDPGWSQRMNNEHVYRAWDISDANWDTLGANGNAPGGDGIDFNDAVDSATVRGCYITNEGHSCINTEKHNINNFGIKHLLIESNVLTAGTSNYCRGLGIGGAESSVFNIVRRNYVHDVNIGSQFGGDSTFAYSNVFVTTAVSPIYHGAQAFACYTIDSTNAYRFIETHLCVANNTIIDTDAAMYLKGLHGSALPLADTSLAAHNQFANNLIVQWRPFPCPSCDSHPDMNTAMFVDTMRAGTWSFRNNGFWKSGADSILLTVVRTGATYDQYVLSTLNARDGCSGNLAGPPAFASGDSTAQYELSVASPYKSSGLSLAQLLPPGMDAIDYNGRPFGVTGSVGAFQYPYVGLDSLSVAGAPGSPVTLNTILSLSASLHPSNADIRTYACGVPPDPEATDYGRILRSREDPACARAGSPRSRSSRSCGSLSARA